ncbi:MAG: hypothetical protein AB7S26_21680 [Sandaracinaceae bacterium]
MPKKSFALERNAPKRLEVEWTGAFADVTVRWDGDFVAGLDRGDLESGTEVPLPAGTTIRLSLASLGTLGNAKRLAVHFADGRPVPGSDDDPTEAGKQAGYILYFIAALNALCGVIAMATQNEMLLNAGAGIASLVMALVMGVLGLFTMRGSRIALGIAIGLYAADWLLGVGLSISDGASPSMGGIFIRIAFIVALGRSFMAMGGPRAD